MLEEKNIGKQIRKLRNEKGLTLDDLAHKTGYSKGYLSKVENSDKAPPVSTLANIVKTLEVSISELFDEGYETTCFSLVKRGERELMAKDGTLFGYSYEALAHKYPNKRMEPYILTIPANIEASPFFQHTGEELFMVLTGRVRFLHGEREVLLEEGDCIYFDSNILHRGFAVDVKQAKCLIVMFST
jgi:transcriptional regulator with XRE-family HTH domain